MTIRQAAYADLHDIEKGRQEHFAHEKNMALTRFFKKVFILQGKQQKQLYGIRLYMFMRKIEIYQAELFQTENNRMNIKNRVEQHSYSCVSFTSAPTSIKTCFNATLEKYESQSHSTSQQDGDSGVKNLYGIIPPASLYISLLLPRIYPRRTSICFPISITFHPPVIFYFVRAFIIDSEQKYVNLPACAN